MVTKYPWLTIKYEWNEKEKVFLVSFYGDKLNDEKFSEEALSFENELVEIWGCNAPLFTDNEELFTLSDSAQLICNSI